MTRGKMILIDKNGDNVVEHITCEFNGDMYISYFGKGIIAELEHISNYEDFERYVKYFNEQNFRYKADYFGISKHFVKDNTINVCDNYFDIWFSDYLYFKNICGEDITIICNINNEVAKVVIKSGEVKVFHFAELVEHEKEIIAEYKSSTEEIEEDMSLYRSLGSSKIDKLYRISCIKASNCLLKDNEVLKLADILEEIYLKDENKRSLGELSDLLVNVRDKITNDLAPREILRLCDIFDIEN